jgi:hypothetical protein
MRPQYSARHGGSGAPLLLRALGSSRAVSDPLSKSGTGPLSRRTREITAYLFARAVEFPTAVGAFPRPRQEGAEKGGQLGRTRRGGRTGRRRSISLVLSFGAGIGRTPSVRSPFRCDSRTVVCEIVVCDEHGIVTLPAADEFGAGRLREPGVGLFASRADVYAQPVRVGCMAYAGETPARRPSRLAARPRFVVAVRPQAPGHGSRTSRDRGARRA